MIIHVGEQQYWVNTQEEAGRRFVFYNQISPIGIGFVSAVVAAVIIFAYLCVGGSIEEVMTWREAVSMMLGAGVSYASGWVIAARRAPDLSQLIKRGLVTLRYSSALTQLRGQVESVTKREAGGRVSKYRLDDPDVDKSLISDYLRVTREDYELLSRHQELDWEVHDALKTEVAKVTRRYMRCIRNDVDRKRHDRAVLEAPDCEAIRDGQERQVLTVQTRAELRLSDHREGLIG